MFERTSVWIHIFEYEYVYDRLDCSDLLCVCCVQYSVAGINIRVRVGA
jgi:hypothetical protein